MNIRTNGFRLTNYHAHTTRCMHASDSEEAYILQAIHSGYEAFGFADHSPWPYKSDFVAGMRMRASQLRDYIDTLRALRKKYSDRIELHIGLECEAFPEYFPWLRDLKQHGDIEYFILGNHYDTTDEYHTEPYFGSIQTPEYIERYVQTTLVGMRSGLFACLCHPDLYLNCYPKFDAAAQDAAHILCREAEKLDLPLEYNLLGMHRNPNARASERIGYTSDEFWNIAAGYHIRAVIGIDAHSAASVDCKNDYIRVREKLSSLGIPVIEDLFQE